MHRPTHDEIEQAVRRILEADLNVNPEVLARADARTPLLGLGIGLDSIEAMILTLGLERDLAVNLADDALTTDSFQSIGTLVEYVGRKLVGSTT